MKLRWIPFVLALIVVAVPAFADAHAEKNAADEPAAAPGMSNADMQKMMAAATPGAEHERLARMAGDWTFTNTMWMAPGQPPMQATGTMHGEMMLDGRFLHSVWKGDVMGQAFEGHSTEGYNNVSKQLEGSWIDNMGTGIMTSTGSCDAAANTCTTTGQGWDPVSGKQMTTRSVTSWTGNDQFKMEMFGPGPDGKEMKMMEIVATRTKSP